MTYSHIERYCRRMEIVNEVRFLGNAPDGSRVYDIDVCDAYRQYEELQKFISQYGKTL